METPTHGRPFVVRILPSPLRFSSVVGGASRFHRGVLMARPRTDLNATITLKEAILRSLAAGATMRQAAAMARVTRQTLYNLMKADEEFALEVAAVEAELIHGITRDIVSADDWRAKKWYVEQRDDDFRKGPIQQAPTMPTGADVPPLPSGVTAEDIRRAAEMDD